MSSPEARHFPNNLPPFSLDEASLHGALDQFRSAITHSLELIEKNTPNPDSDKHDNLYTGNSGIALMYLRLSQQLPSPSLPVEKLLECVSIHNPRLDRHRLSTSRLSPVGSPVGPAVVELSRQLIMGVQDDASGETWDIAAATLKRAIDIALEFGNGGDEPGAMEVLYGRAGLLWAVLNLRWLLGRVGEEGKRRPRLKALGTIVDVRVVAGLVDGLIAAGERGKADFEKQYGEDGMPLMWEWHGKYYLGAMHGSTGILTIILQAPPELITPHISLILPTIKALLQLSLNFAGRLPPSLPAKQRTHTYVQICHGSPGLLLLLSTLKESFPDLWDEDKYGHGREMAAGNVWEEGLVRKGLGLCHGVAGNAWTLMLLGDDVNLSRALLFLLHTTRLPPLKDEDEEIEYQYRRPDHPWSLFEGLAGAVCAWSEACVVLELRLGERGEGRMLGMPSLGGRGVGGVV